MLAAVLDIRGWLEADRHKPLAERLHRDRKIGRALTDRSSVGQVLGWWLQVGAMPSEVRASSAPEAAPEAALDATLDATPGIRVAHACTMSGVVLLLLGFVGGVAVSGAAFAYEGQYPVNLFTLLGVLVGLPLLFLAVTLLMLFLSLIHI